jgi:hypothetical protein
MDPGSYWFSRQRFALLGTMVDIYVLRRRCAMRGMRFVTFCFILSIVSLNPAFAQDDKARKFFAVQEMVNSVQKNEKIRYTVMLKRYFIEGVPYSTTMMTVSPKHTFNIAQTNDGFEAFALFRKEDVHKEAYKDNKAAEGVAKVKLKVLLDDIFLIVGHKESGEQITLYE